MHILEMRSSNSPFKSPTAVQGYLTMEVLIGTLPKLNRWKLIAVKFEYNYCQVAAYG